MRVGRFSERKVGIIGMTVKIKIIVEAIPRIIMLTVVRNALINERGLTGVTKGVLILEKE
jgi:hypothetical protein